ncbi:MAG: Sec-independent protein translocase subunit TatA/TatB [Acidimicrobiales bacterium]
MGSISPAKILLLLLVALIVLGPERLPDMARKAGKLFNDFRRVRTGLENEVREAFGDIPGINGTSSITSPMSWLTSATKMADTSTTASAGGQAEGAPGVEPAPSREGAPMTPPESPAFGPAQGMPVAPAGVVNPPRRSVVPPPFQPVVASDDPSLN